MAKAIILPAPPPLTPRNERQREYQEALEMAQVVIGEGPAGTGKTYMAVSHAVSLLVEERVKRLVFTRPMVPAEDDPGALPGSIDEKFHPYFIPILEVLEQLLTPKLVRQLMMEKVIIVAPLAVIRGRTFHRSCMVLDEAQNTTPSQMKLFLSRIGERSQVIVNGDRQQSDISGPSGLADAARRLEGMAEVGHVVFQEQDIVRSELCRKIMQRYSNDHRPTGAFPSAGHRHHHVADIGALRDPETCGAQEPA